jgi:hypothetical protein
MEPSIGLSGIAGVHIGKHSMLFRGENDYFRIQMHKENLDINQECFWGVPIVETEQAS